MDEELKELLESILHELRYRPTPIENVLSEIRTELKGIKEAIKTLLIWKEQKQKELPFNPIFLRRIEDCEMSVRSMNGMRRGNIVYIGDLVQKTESDLMQIPFLGRKSLREIKWLLDEMGLSLGLKIPGWNPEELESIYE